VYGAGDVLWLESGAQRARAYAVLSEWLKKQSPGSRHAWLQVLSERLQVSTAMGASAQVLDWDELRALVRDGLVVAPHSRNHELLDQVDQATLRCEASGSRDEITRHIGECPPIFAYPNGNFDARTLRTLRETGYACAFTTIGGLDVLPTREPFMLRREQARGSLLRLAVKLTPGVAAWRRARKPLPAGEQDLWSAQDMKM
jgi:peptidoglycan/xylan/chitin deacetylase (PgdA/CDA1 family)